ncbi:MAG: hypothetical protein ACRD2D_01365, partial [Terriglobales bacterium]
MSPEEPLHWVFCDPLPEQAARFQALVEELADAFAAQLRCTPSGAGWLWRADFSDEETGRAFWLELHSRCLDGNLALELAPEPLPSVVQWRAASAAEPAAPDPVTTAAAAPSALQRFRPPIPAETAYDLLRTDDPELDKNLDETVARIQAACLPVINLLSYLDLPLFQRYAEDHPDEREQTLFLHMLHTWTCYRHFGEIHATLPESLVQAFTSPIYLRLNTTQFRSPAPALCLQFASWSMPVRGGARGTRLQWAKEIYLTHFEPPTPAEDRELTLMFVLHDEAGEYGFVPLEVPLSLPGVGQSIDAFFAPGADDSELGANTEDLRRLTSIAATYCLY